MKSIWKNKFGLALTIALMAEGTLYYTALGSEKPIQLRPLEFFTENFGGWHMLRQGQVSKDELEILRADDTMIREYGNSSEGYATLYVAFFKTQRAGQAPHSPKNCLPGSGWEPMEEGTMDIGIAGQPQPITVNRYLVARGENASVVFYWYQSRKRVIASEYSAKLWLVADSIRYHRSDTALVRVVVPVVRGDDGRATRTGVEFIQSVFSVLQNYLPA